tara:strand:- start:105 stop:644 length:540 start_codon:yes stop_codon:yes gene_type:complete
MLVLATISFAQDERPEDVINSIRQSSKEGYLGATWGMKEQEVIEALQKRSLSFTVDANSIHVQKNVAGLNTNIQFSFFGLHLRKVFLVFDKPEQGVLHFSKLQKLLTLKYGSPIKETDEINETGTTKETDFQTDESYIGLYHFFYDKTRLFGLTYRSKRMEEYEQALSRSTHANDLDDL